MARAEVLALRVMADRLEDGESEPVSIDFSLPLTASAIGRQPRPTEACLHTSPLDGR